MTRLLPAALALACALAIACSPALAQTAAAAADGSLVVPWGTWLTNALTGAAAIAVPVLTAFAVKGIQQVAPWAALFLSNARVEAMVQQSVAYALNAVAGAAKGGVLTIPVGSTVIATAVQRAIDAAPAAVIKAAGGPQGVAERVFRTLHLEADATAANTLAPVIPALPAARR